MVSYTQLVNAMNRINGWRDGIECGKYEQQLVNSLDVYKTRGEFDGTVHSAIKCLQLAGYTVEIPTKG